jgi:tetratricopeptide (TPR) repeat protein
MKRSFLLSVIGVFILAFLVYNKSINPHIEISNNRILEANLLAALDLESKYISTCGPLTFEYFDYSAEAPILEGLGDHSFSITNVNAKSQTYFDQGLNLTYGFNHTEAHRSFKQAAKISENATMAYWGQAYALSPNINDANIDKKRRMEASVAISLAIEHLDGANQLEKALVDALSLRFTKNENGVIEVDNESYMKEMANVAEKYPDNPDVLTLYAASIMNTMPWNYWNKNLLPHNNTLKAKEALEAAILINPKHPGAHHYYIHLTELPYPKLAAKSGDALAPLMPGAGHMVHMPSHAYIRVGRYFDAAVANMKAIKSDEGYISQCYSQGNYPLGYYPHNIHFLWYAATVMGDSKTAIAAAKKTSEKVSTGQLAEMEFMQEFASIPIQAYVRFGQWNEILTIPYPGDNVKHMKLFWHYARGLSFVRKDLLVEAKEELDSLEKIIGDESYEQIFASINNSLDVAKVAYHVVAGDYFAAMGNTEIASNHFKKAIINEDALTYTEPPSWHLPTRHNYGAFLLDQGKYKEAEIIYKEDLKVFWNNGWSLIGLHDSYLGQDDEAKAKETKDRFEESWQYADITISRSVY